MCKKTSCCDQQEDAARADTHEIDAPSRYDLLKTTQTTWHPHSCQWESADAKILKKVVFIVSEVVPVVWLFKDADAP